MNIIRCAKCAHQYNQRDWWCCPQCGAPSPDALRAKRVPKPKRDSFGGLKELLP